MNLRLLLVLTALALLPAASAAGGPGTADGHCAERADEVRPEAEDASAIRDNPQEKEQS